MIHKARVSYEVTLQVDCEFEIDPATQEDVLLKARRILVGILGKNKTVIQARVTRHQADRVTLLPVDDA